MDQRHCGFEQVGEQEREQQDEESASGEVEEFDAALARGAAGVFAEPGVEEPLDDGSSEGGNGGVDVATLGEPSEVVEESDGVDGGGNGGVTTVDALEEGPEPARPRRKAARAEPRSERQSLWARATAFLRASWAELQRMQWPDRRQTSQATAVVLGFVVVAGIYLGVADWIAQKIVNLII